MREHSLQDIYFAKYGVIMRGSVDQKLSIADFLQWGMSNVRAIKLYNCSTVISFQCSVLLPGVGGRSAVTSCWYLFVSCTTCYIISLSKNNMKYSYGSDSIVNGQSLVNPELSISKSYVWRTNSSPIPTPAYHYPPIPPVPGGGHGIYHHHWARFRRGDRSPMFPTVFFILFPLVIFITSLLLSVSSDKSLSLCKWMEPLTLLAATFIPSVGQYERKILLGHPHYDLEK